MDYDAIIVGARVAGSSLAILLGRQGRRVLLIDKDRFPSDTLSTHLLKPPAVELLGRLGALAEVEAPGLRRLARSP
jgi:flavin-dependent dehydrogenase